MRKHVAPIHADASIPDPDRGGFLPAEGRIVSWTPHWAGMLARDEVIATDAPADIELDAEREVEPAMEPQTQLPAPAAPADPAPEAKADPSSGTTAAVPFMITAANRKRLKALGKTDDEIATMKPEDAQAILQDAPAA